MEKTVVITDRGFPVLWRFLLGVELTHRRVMVIIYDTYQDSMYVAAEQVAISPTECSDQSWLERPKKWGELKVQ